MTRVSHEQKVLALLSDGREHSHHEGYALNVMWHSRIAKLKKLGYVIERRQVGQTHWYRLVSRPLVGSPAASQGADGTGGPTNGYWPPLLLAARLLDGTKWKREERRCYLSRTGRSLFFASTGDQQPSQRSWRGRGVRPAFRTTHTQMGSSGMTSKRWAGSKVAGSGGRSL